MAYYPPGVWTAYTPTVTSQAGTITTQTGAAGRWTQIGKKVTVTAQVTITTVGTATQAANFTLPVASSTVSSQYYVGSGLIANTAVILLCYMTGNVLQLRTTAGAFPCTDGQTIALEITYEAA